MGGKSPTTNIENENEFKTNSKNWTTEAIVGGGKNETPLIYRNSEGSIVVLPTTGWKIPGNLGVEPGDNEA